MKRAQEAELQAQQTRQMAEAARGEAEKLIVYLLDDFYLELEPVGRLDIVAALSKRAIDYYAALPPELRTPETDRNRALALVRYGAALRNQSKLDESGKALSEAVGVLSKLRTGGDQSEATAVGLGVGLTVAGPGRGESEQARRRTGVRHPGGRRVETLDGVAQPFGSVAAGLWPGDDLPRFLPGQHRRGRDGGGDAGGGAQSLPKHR